MAPLMGGGGGHEDNQGGSMEGVFMEGRKARRVGMHPKVTLRGGY